VKIKHIATFFIICSITSCSLILPLSIVDKSAKMDLLSTDEYYEQFVRFAQMKAEATNPKGDVWYGGTGDPHLTAAAEGLTEKYKSKHFNDLLTAAQNQAKFSDYKSVGIYVGALGYGYNTKLLKEKGLPVPKSWADLTNPVYKGEVQMANPNASGTAYTTLATILQIFGEDKGWEYMKKLHMNINQYTKSGSAPIKATGRSDNAMGFTNLVSLTSLNV
jgi:iron(III) transport system substrate-binding protein